nr:MAG TPA_asm: hypothetical protein [Caudoviricetes sp.]DAV46302.1 MAG TPA: hypothetical protein [Caudoviricetes sp.]
MLGVMMQHLLLACGEPVVIVTSPQMGTKLILGSHKRYVNIKVPK